MTQALKVNEQNEPYELIICGAGHAGCEAALAAAKQNADVLLLTGNLDTIAFNELQSRYWREGKARLFAKLMLLGVKWH